MKNFKESFPIFDFTAVDIETTGLDRNSDEIIEIGVVKFKNNKVSNSFQSFINIENPLPAHIKTLTHISDKDLLNASSQKIVLDNFLNFIKDDILCFHNADFDYNFINSGLKSSSFSELKNVFYDTLEISRIFLPHIKSHSLGKLNKFFKITNENPHRAVGDAKSTGKLFSKLIEFILENYEIGTINRIIELAKLAKLSSGFVNFLEQLRKYQIKTSFLKQKEKSSQAIFFPQTNFISNLLKDEKPAQKFSETEILKMFEKKGQLDKNFVNYEIRDGQIDMVAWTSEAYKDGKILLIEAGTGVGKSLAYLIPSIFFSKFSKKKIIISANTKNLQEQLFFKDIFTIQKVTNLTFSAVLLKGRNNYLCQRKWNEIATDWSGYLTQFEMKLALNLIVWAINTKTGDIEENYSFRQTGTTLWQKVAADSNYCYGKKCSFYEECFVMKIRSLAEKSNLVIVNHSLLLSDAVSENSVLGDYSDLVIDEVHNLPQIAATHFGFSVSIFDFMTISKKILTKAEFQFGIVNNIKIAVTKSMIQDSQKNDLKNKLEDILIPLEDLSNASSDFFTNINQIAIEKGSYGKLRFQNLSIFKSSQYLVEALNNHLSRLYKILNNLYIEIKKISPNVFPFHDKNISDLDGILNQIYELQLKFQQIFSPDFENFAFWLETTDKKFSSELFPHCSIVCAPIEVNRYLYEFFWSKLETTILTSATIAIRNEYKFFKNLTGLDKVDDNKLMEFIASSPFDYPNQMRILIPDFLPNPQDKFFNSQAISLLEETISAHNRGTLVLFTSHRDLNLAFSELTNSAIEQDITLLAQNKTGSRTSILDTFREDENSVLLGTRSFWEGIDVQGKSLEILLLYRLPFLVPTEPLVEAYMDKLQRDGKNSFLYYLLPISLLHFKQGFGRLIRNKTDKGVVIILDSRILKKDYGKYFIEVMPVKPIKVTSSLGMTDYITGWFEKI